MEESISSLKKNVESISKNLAELELFQSCFQLLKSEPSPKEQKELIPLLNAGKLTLKELYSKIKSYPKYFKSKKIEFPTLIKKMNDLVRYSQEYEIQIKTKNPKAICYVDLLDLAYRNLPSIGSRFDEYFWVSKKLGTIGNFLDVGCYGPFTQELSKIKSLDVYGIDLRELNLKPNFKFFLEDASKTHFDNNFFEQIIAISSIEHFGLEAFANQNIDENLDLKTMKELKRILKNEGRIFVTVPFGDGDRPTYRKYNESRLNQLFEGFIIKEKTFIRQTHVGWVETSMEEASKLGNSMYYPFFPAAVAMIVATKSN